MSARVKALLAIDSGADRNAVEAVIPVDEALELVGVMHGLEAGLEGLDRMSVDALLVACAGDGEDALPFIEGISRQYPEHPVVVLHHGAPDGFAGRAFAMGAEDVVGLPHSNGQPASPVDRQRVSSELAAAIAKAVARRRRSVTGRNNEPGRMVTVLGPKGGAGKTLVSCSLAVTLAEAGERVVLVDLDLQFGDVGLALGLEPAKTIYDLVQSGGSLDAEKLIAYLPQHESGARVLLAPTRPDQATAVRTEFLRSLFDVLRASEQWVVVDTSPGFTPEVIAAIDASTDVCMVGTLDAPSLKNTKLGLETLELMDLQPERIKLVLNRADSRVGVSTDDAEAITGRQPDVLVPSHRDIARAVNEAQPIVSARPASDGGRALRSLAESYLGVGSTRRRGLLGRRR
jgi:pilus assembly protein CpaE